jgi:hypothetical protein
MKKDMEILKQRNIVLAQEEEQSRSIIEELKSSMMSEDVVNSSH